MSEASLAASYDRAPYDSKPVTLSHPSRAAALARLMGLDAPPVERCRVLELGCAGGGNLIPMAASIPTAEFVGIDLSARQIVEGSAIVKSLGLENVTLKEFNLLDLADEFGRFDYIIAHGVYSWIPPAAREKLLSICARNLAENGVAFVSYNTYPGWYFRGLLREVMEFHTRDLTDPARRATEARLADALGGWMQQQETPFAGLLRAEVQHVQSSTDSAVLHDYLEEHNDPVYFHEFVEALRPHELQYLWDAAPHGSALLQFPPHIASALAELSRDWVERELLADVLRKRTLRMSLLCHPQSPGRLELRPERMSGLHVASAVRPFGGSGDTFSMPQGNPFTVPHAAVRDALSRLAQAWPGSVPFHALQGDSALAFAMVELLLRNIVEVHSQPPAFITQVQDHPRASPLARLQARQSSSVTNLRHETVELGEAHRQLMTQLDGGSSRESMSAAALSDLARFALLLP